MHRHFTRLTCAAALALAVAPAAAQESGATGDQSGATTPGAEQQSGAATDQLLDMGEQESGGVYTEDTFEDWELRCAANPNGEDPCQLYQLINDSEGNSVAEMSVFEVPEGNQAAAGATIVTPLETLLTEQVSVSVDGGTSRSYPFTWCSEVGCFARIGFTPDDLNAFRRGVTATLTIVPVAAPDQNVDLDVSLSGFTAGFDALTSLEGGGSGPE